MSYFIYTDLICSLLDPRVVDPVSTLIHIGAYDSISSTLSFWRLYFLPFPVCCLFAFHDVIFCFVALETLLDVNIRLRANRSHSTYSSFA